MKIPRSFQLGGIVWKVEQTTPLMGAMGASFLGQALVQIDKDLPQQVKQQTFYHELVHTILYAMGKINEPHDEVFVDGFASFLHQFMQTAK